MIRMMGLSRYDIVGCGAVVQVCHVPALWLKQRQGLISIAGCFDPDVASADRIADLLGASRRNAHAVPSEGDGVDVALIATPPGAHAELADAYIRAGKNVLVEKPFTTTPSEASELVKAARNRGVTLAVNHFWRFFPSVATARAVLAGGGLGRILRIEASYGYRWNWPASDYVTKDPFGGVVHDFGSHLVDMILFILRLDGPQNNVSFEVDKVERDPPHEPSHEYRARLFLETPQIERIEVDLAVSRKAAIARAMKIWGSDGLLFVPTVFASAPILSRGGSYFAVSGIGQPETTPANRWEDCFVLAHQEFLDATRGQGSTRLSAERFLLQMDMLESLRTAGT